MKLNDELLKKQKVTKSQKRKLIKLYKDIFNLFKRAKDDNNIEQNGLSYALELEKIEYELQENWNFEKNNLYHTWWYKIPGCTCPYLDNAESFGIEKIINCNCPFHKNLCKE